MKNPICWFEIYVNDIERAKKFYESVFNLTLTKLDLPEEPQNQLEMWTFPADEDNFVVGGAIVKTQYMPAGSNSTVVYFSCADCAVEESRVAAAGGNVQTSKMSIGEHGFVSLVKDSEGNLIGLHSLG